MKMTQADVAEAEACYQLFTSHKFPLLDITDIFHLCEFQIMYKTPPCSRLSYSTEIHYTKVLKIEDRLQNEDKIG